MISCNSDSSTTTYELSSDATVKKLLLSKNDSVTTQLDKVFFTIDQANGLIYNADSLPVTTKLKKKLLTEITFSSASKCIVYMGSDSLNYTKTDSVDFRLPVKLKVTASDGVTVKWYDVKLNIHKQVPDSLQWHKVSDEAWPVAYSKNRLVESGSELLAYLKTTSGFALYTASKSNPALWSSASLTDFPDNIDVYSITAFKNRIYAVTTNNQLWISETGRSWSKLPVNGAFYAIYGSVSDNQSVDRLIVLQKNDGVFQLLSSTDGNTFAVCYSGTLPDDFPVRGFASINHSAFSKNRLTLIGGVDKNNALLNTVHQIQWTNSGFLCAFNMNNSNSFAAREGATALYYNDKMILTGGKIADGTVSRLVYSSIENGISWQLPKLSLPFPASFEVSAYASVYVDANSWIWLFGGVKSSGATKNEIWRGRVNRLGFVK